jgi:hypothetical protein
VNLQEDLVFIPRKDLMIIGMLRAQVVSLGDKQILSAQDILLVYQNVQVAKRPKCKVSVDRSSQGWSFVRDCRNLVCLKQGEQPEQFAGEKMIMEGSGVEIISKQMKGSLGNCFRTGGIEVPVEEGEYSMQGSDVDQMRPGNLFFAKIFDPLCSGRVHTGPGTAEEQLRFRSGQNCRNWCQWFDRYPQLINLCGLESIHYAIRRNPLRKIP